MQDFCVEGAYANILSVSLEQFQIMTGLDGLPVFFMAGESEIAQNQDTLNFHGLRLVEIRQKILFGNFLRGSGVPRHAESQRDSLSETCSRTTEHPHDVGGIEGFP